MRLRLNGAVSIAVTVVKTPPFTELHFVSAEKNANHHFFPFAGRRFNWTGDLFNASFNQTNSSVHKTNSTEDPADSKTSSSEYKISRCSLPPFQNHDQLFTCQSMNMSRPMSIQSPEFQKLAVIYAPVVFFHPLENYTLSSANTTFDSPSSGEVYHLSENVHLERIDSTLNLTTLLNTTRDINTSFNAKEYFFVHDSANGYFNGDGFEFVAEDNDTPNGTNINESDGIGKNRVSRASIYYKIIDSGDNTLTFNYYFYYTFSGQSNIICISSVNGRSSQTSFQLAPLGTHEGDWEEISVKICRTSIDESTGDFPDVEDLPQPLAVSYRRHSWNRITDCTRGECHFFEDTHHPVAFAALSSHAMYPFPSFNNVYQQIPAVPFLANLHGFLLVDRTAYMDKNNKISFFMPNATNIIRLLDPNEVEYNITPEESYWHAFGGHWGNSTISSAPLQEPECLNENQTAFIACPTKEEDPVFFIIMQIIGAYPPDEDSGLLASSNLFQEIADYFTNTGVGPTGPITKHSFTEWTAALNAPLWNFLPWNTTQAEYCEQMFIIIPDTGRPPNALDNWNIRANLIGVVSMVIILPVGTSLCLSRYIKIFSKPPLQINDENDAVQQPESGWKNQIFATVFGFAFWYLVTIMGAIIFVVSHDHIFILLEKYLTTFNWSLITKLISLLSIVSLIIDTLVMIFLWLPSYIIHCKLWQLYYTLTNNYDLAEKYDNNHSRLVVSFKNLQRGYIVCFGFLLTSMMLSVVFVVVSVAIVGFSYAFSSACYAVSNPIEGKFSVDDCVSRLLFPRQNYFIYCFLFFSRCLYRHHHFRGRQNILWRRFGSILQ